MNRISVINDEISDNFKETVLFLKKHGVSYVELRSINKKNIANIPLQRIKKYANYLKKNNIGVSCIASPILKWYPNNIDKGDYKNLKIDNFYFNKNQDLSYENIFKIAKIFDSKYIRIFSFLKYADFKISDLDSEIKKLVHLAIKYNKVLLIENEPVCNIRTINDLLEFIRKYKSEKIKILFDIGNLYKQGDRVDKKNLLKIKKYIKYIHIKDYSLSQNKYVALGEGDINYKRYLSLINKLVSGEIFYSIETHVNSNSKSHKTLISIQRLKEVLNAI